MDERPDEGGLLTPRTRERYGEALRSVSSEVKDFFPPLPEDALGPFTLLELAQDAQPPGPTHNVIWRSLCARFPIDEWMMFPVVDARDYEGQELIELAEPARSEALRALDALSRDISGAKSLGNVALFVIMMSCLQRLMSGLPYNDRFAEAVERLSGTRENPFERERIFPGEIPEELARPEIASGSVRELAGILDEPGRRRLIRDRIENPDSSPAWVDVLRAAFSLHDAMRDFPDQRRYIAASALADDVLARETPGLRAACRGTYPRTPGITSSFRAAEDAIRDTFLDELLGDIFSEEDPWTPASPDDEGDHSRSLNQLDVLARVTPALGPFLALVQELIQTVWAPARGEKFERLSGEALTAIRRIVTRLELLWHRTPCGRGLFFRDEIPPRSNLLAVDTRTMCGPNRPIDSVFVMRALRVLDEWDTGGYQARVTTYESRLFE